MACHSTPPLMVRQLSIEIAMRGAVECHAFELTISVALIGIREPSKPGISENHLHGCFSIEITHRYPLPEKLIRRETLGWNGHNRLLVKRASERRSIVDDDTGRSVELSLGYVGQCWDGVWLGEICLEERYPLSVLAPVPFLDAAATLRL